MGHKLSSALAYLAALCLCLVAAAGHAQSVPNGGTIVQGEVWTPAQWMSAWQSKVDTVNGVMITPNLGQPSYADLTNATNVPAGVPPTCQAWQVLTNFTGSPGPAICSSSIGLSEIVISSTGSFTSTGSTVLSGGLNPDGESTLRFDGTQSATGPLGVSIWGLTTYTPNGASNVNFLQTQTHLGASLIPISNYEAMFCAQQTIDVGYGIVNAPPNVQCFEAQGFDDNRANATTVPVPNWSGFVADNLQNGNGMSAGNTKGAGFSFNGLNPTATNNGGAAVYYGNDIVVPANNQFAPTGTTAISGLHITGSGGGATGAIAIFDIGSVATPNTGGGDGTKFIVNFQSAANITKVFPMAVGQQLFLAAETPTGYNGLYTVQATPAPVVVTIATVHTSQFALLGATTGAQSVAGTFSAVSTTIASTVTASSASIAATNTFAAGQPIGFTGSFGSVTGLSTGTIYYVISTGLSGSAFQISATVGGSAITPGGSSTATPTVIVLANTSPTKLAIDDESTLNNIVMGLWQMENGSNVFGGNGSCNGGTSFFDCNMNAGTSSGHSNIGNANSTLNINAGTFAGTYFSAHPAFTMGSAQPITPASNAGIVGVTGATAAVAGSYGELQTVTCNSDAASVTVTISIASPAVITWTGLISANATSTAGTWTCPINFTTSGTLPTGLTANTPVWLISSTLTNVTNSTFQVADTAAHAMAGTNAITTTGSQSGTQTGQVGAFKGTGQAGAGSGMALTAGDWDCTGIAAFTGTSATQSGYFAGIGTSDTSQPNFPNSVTTHFNALATTTENQVVPLTTVTENVSSTTNIFEVGTPLFTAGSINVGGFMRCRRMH